MRGCETDSLDPRRGDCTKQISETGLIVKVSAVGVNILAKKGNLLNAIRLQRLGIGNDILHRTGFFPAAHIRNNAVRAEVVATNRYRKPCRPLRLALAWQISGKIRGFRKNLHLMLKERLLDKAREACKIESSEHHVYMGKLFDELFPIALADAAADNDNALFHRSILAQGNIFK